MQSLNNLVRHWVEEVGEVERIPLPKINKNIKVIKDTVRIYDFDTQERTTQARGYPVEIVALIFEVIASLTEGYTYNVGSFTWDIMNRLSDKIQVGEI